MSVTETIKDKAGTLKGKAGALWSSAHELNKLAVDKIEEASKLSLDSAAYFSGVGIKQIRAAGAIKDMESMRSFTAGSITLSGEIAKKMMEDSKAMLGIGASMKDKITDMFPSKEEAVKKKAPTKPVAV